MIVGLGRSPKGTLRPRMTNQNLYFGSFQDSQWCWCVDRKTGTSIPGTSMQGKRPDCTVTPRVFPGRVTDREWIKCSVEEKAKFKRHLKNFLVNVMDQQGDYLTQMPVETVAKWHFYKLDKNHDGVIKVLKLFILKLQSIHS